MTPGRLGMGLAYGMAAGALWGLAFLAPELAADFTPLQLSTGRYLAYGLFSGLMLIPRWKTLGPLIGRREWRALIGLGLLGNVLYYVLLSYAVRLSGIAMTSLIIGLLPGLLTVIGSRGVNAVPLRKLAPTLVFGLAGITCASWGRLEHAAPGGIGIQVTGWFCALLALVSWTIFAVLNQQWLERLHQISSHDWSLLTGGATGVLTLLLAGPAFMLTVPGNHDGIMHGIHEWAGHSALDWARFIAVATGIGILASIVGNAFWNRMSRLLPMTLAGQMILFETLFALLYGFLWDHRVPTFPETLAILFVSVSVLSGVMVHRHQTDVVALEPS
ncbi:DMT family transporter [Komagataeibacter intermedius]|uniref:Multidrug DMT transporter permease n=1 Tax=Komagataeibacter intermedius AF2 TaxID=1458464 RepID=A0A0C1VI51_9PROT|nr:DMT family transporter [Komagataeibacter intermedius]KPH85062.1 multidrug DMT transporter permease [Komagataeibacter intermedius AF2]KPH88017.1 multidrug DMT transporter permease [Komagataeibacter intermedius AF2]